MAVDGPDEEGAQAPASGLGLSRHSQLLLYGWLLGWICAASIAVVAVAVWWPGLLTAAFTIALAGIGAVPVLVMEKLEPGQRVAVNALLARAIRNYILALGFIAFPPTVYTAIRGISGVEDEVLRIAGLSACAILLVAALVIMHDGWFREYSARRPWIFSLWVYAGTVVTSAAALFAAVTWELYRAEVVELTPAPKDAGGLVDFYMYYLFDAAPGHITETLRWEPPYAYTQSGTGALVLLFTLVVAAPVLGFVVDQWRRRQAWSQLDAGSVDADSPWWDRRRWWSWLRNRTR